MILEGLRVTDFSENLAGPYCTQILADLGADVVKVERPGGDPARAWGPPFWGTESPMFLSVNRNKRSLAIDLKAGAGREAARRLSARSDVVVQSFRAGVAESLGLGPDDARASNPRLIYCSVTAFGRRGPLRDEPGYDALMQAYAGLMSLTGHPGQPPSRLAASIVDLGTGMWAAIGVLAALRERDRTGAGCHVTTALFDTALAHIGYQLMNYFASGEVPGPPGSGLGTIAPYAAFPTADGQLMIAAGNDGLFARACRALGLEELMADPRFRDNASRVRNRSAIEAAFREATRRRTSAALERVLRDAGVPCAPVLPLDRVAAEPQTEASGMLEPLPHPRIEGYRAPGLPVEWDGERPPTRRVPPRVGEHTVEILAELGLEPEP